jgi:hypothetical protein
VTGDAAAVCAFVGALALGGLSAAGRPLLGFALAAGLLLGAGNHLLAARSFATDLDFRAVSAARLLAISVVLGSGGALLGWNLLPLAAAGVALAELLLAGVAIHQALRA